MSIPVIGWITDNAKVVVIGLAISALSGLYAWDQYKSLQICELEKENMKLQIEGDSAKGALEDKEAIDDIGDAVAGDLRDEISKSRKDAEDIADDVDSKLEKLREAQIEKQAVSRYVEEPVVHYAMSKPAKAKPAAAVVSKPVKGKVHHEESSFDPEFHRAASRIIVDGMWRTYCNRSPNDSSCASG